MPMQLSSDLFMCYVDDTCGNAEERNIGSWARPDEAGDAAATREEHEGVPGSQATNCHELSDVKQSGSIHDNSRTASPNLQGMSS